MVPSKYSLEELKELSKTEPKLSNQDERFLWNAFLDYQYYNLEPNPDFVEYDADVNSTPSPTRPPKIQSIIEADSFKNIPDRRRLLNWNLGPPESQNKIYSGDGDDPEKSIQDVVLTFLKKLTASCFSVTMKMQLKPKALNTPTMPLTKVIDFLKKRSRKYPKMLQMVMHLCYQMNKN